ncbi:lipoyl(octanoyl) transferase LipB [Gemmatimonadota bacterium]
MPEETGRPLQLRRLGQLAYQEALDLQKQLVERRRSGEIPDQLLLLEHPHVITLGTSSEARHVLLSPEELAARGIELHDAGRGGDVTYHGPGQLVGYPILALSPNRRDLHRYLRDLEEVLVRTLEAFGIDGWREDGYTGVWTKDGKVAAIGVRVSSGWITSHGFALNVSPDLQYFTSIVPCGIQDRPVTSMARILGRDVMSEEVVPDLVRCFEELFQRDSGVA